MTPDPVLIVDDEADLRIPLKESLVADGYNVDDAESAQVALEMIQQKHYAVIVTDLHMPGGPSGLDLVNALKVRDPQALCVVITGYASLDVSVRALKCGVYDFVQKPFKILEFEAVLDRALDHARLRHELEGYQKNLEKRVLEGTQELKAFHSEVLCLNGILMDVQGAVDEATLLEPFLRYLQTRFNPDGFAMFRPHAGKLVPVLRQGERPWFPASRLPKLLEKQEWTWSEGYPDGYVVPLRRGQQLLGVLYLGFDHRTAFHPEDSSFLFWCAQVEAALHGLSCMQARLAQATSRR